MAGCCPPEPAVVAAGQADVQTSIADNQILRGESTECYMATASNPTGKHDDATDNVPNKIDNPTITLDANAHVDMTFRLQEGSTRTPTKWLLKNADTGTGYGQTFANGVTWDENTGHLVGTFAGDDLGKTFKVTLAAMDADGEIDNRGYNFAAAKAQNGDSIQFIHPLPGAIVTSRFDPNRKHPVTGVVKPHGGCDLALPGHKTDEVLAAADGECIFTGFEAGGAGNYIKIKHLNSAGKHLCTSVYMHLAKIYVTEGQKVQAGQKIGFEGNTGIGTGAHLHFECRLPNNTKIDPEPLIRGELQVARSTDANNDAAGTIETKQGTAVLTPANVDAKQSSCAAFGPHYPNDATPPPAQQPPPAPASTDPFELAWALTMKTEVIPWTVTPPTVQSTLDGLVDTKPHSFAVGYTNDPADSGGITKFGISQRNNKQVSVPSIDYATARQTGYNNYWVGKPSGDNAATKPRTAIAMFNLGYLLGPGGIASVISKANVASLADVPSVDAICDAAKDRFTSIIAAKPSQAKYRNGWFNRVEIVRSYCKSVSV